MSRLILFKHSWDYLKMRKRFWLLPIIIMMLLLGLLLVFTEGSALSPFIYVLF